MASWKSAAPLQTAPSPQTTPQKAARTWSPYSKFNTPQLLQLAYTKRSEMLELGGGGVCGGDLLRRELLNINLIESLRDRMLVERMMRKRTSGGAQQTPSGALKKQKAVYIGDENDEEAMSM
ncbi:hypothetical protein QR680_007592 [Steinernema hermaphroditum]|uniref:Uncharacterized protein n=1 Tax=Steinernema hermaphroditum TaxID=289476 RepID=A0AA39IF81_9BILA|nr:hypothetical protein QR680_007592 [Steinernema hermaphroditum]